MKYLKISLIGFVIIFTSCSTMKQNINKNHKKTLAQMETLFSNNGNSFSLNSTNLVLSTVWTYTNESIFIYRLVKGKLVKQETYSLKESTKFKYDFKDELMQSGCIELDGDEFSFKGKNDIEIETQNLPINIKCFTQKQYQSQFLNKIVEDINTYKLWNVQ